MNTPSLQSTLLERIRSGTRAPIPDAEFDALARAGFRHQYECNPVYRAFCERRGTTPDTVAHWTAIPAVPTDAFKAATLLCGDPEDAVAVFQTSGTTAGAERRGRHFFPDLTLYDAALREGFRAHLLPDSARLRLGSLVPPPDEAPDSSLSYMVGAVMAEFGAPGSDHFVRGGVLEAERLAAALREAEAAGEPVGLLGTSFAFVHLLDELRRTEARIHLPHGSRIMDTGGFKGRSREVTREELYTGFQERLGTPAAWCVNEYGMTEMSSQFYDGFAGDAPPPAERLHHGPAWVRTRSVDPETLEILPDGEIGILRHWDLANLHSVLALQTADQGICEADGFRLLGRAPGAEPRGCSIAMDELLSVIERRR